MTYVPVALNADSRRSIAVPIELSNWYARPKPQDSASLTPADIIPTPGFAERTVFAGQIQGVYREAGVRGGMLHVVAGGRLYSVSSSWVATDIGAVDSGEAEFAGLRDDLYVAVNTRLWKWDGANLTEVTDIDLPDVETMIVLNQRLVVSEPNSDVQSWSNTLDGTSIEALAFTTAEQSPDKIRRLVKVTGQYVAMGESGLEVFRAVPDPDLPFRNINNQAIEESEGLLAKNAVARSGDKIFFIGGNFSAYIMSGFAVAPIKANRELEEILRDMSEADQQETRCFAYRDGSHEHFVVKPKNTRAFVYDNSTKLWHTRTNNDLGYYAPDYHTRAYGKDVVAVGNSLYTLENNAYAEADGSEIIRTVTYKVKTRNHDAIGSIAFDLKTYDHPQSGQGLNPQMIVQISDDDRNMPSPDLPNHIVDIPAQGQTEKPVIWGVGAVQPAHGLTLHCRISDPVGVSMVGIWVNEGFVG